MPRANTTTPVQVTMHVPENKNGRIYMHDCSGFPDEPQFDKFKLTKPHLFRDGDVVDLPPDCADFFIRAGVAAKDGEELLTPDRTKPIFVQPHSTRNGVSVQSPK